MMLPFISGFSDHWLRAERSWKKWPLQPKVAFGADVISRTGFGPSKGRIHFSPPGQLGEETFYPDQARVADPRALSKVTRVTYLQIGPAYSRRHQLRNGLHQEPCSAMTWPMT
jgi:hypothetical protein